MPSIIGLGHAMCDINAEVTREEWYTLKRLLKIGDENAPLHLNAQDAYNIVHFIKETTKNKNSISYNAGGSSLNAVRVASFLGVRTSMHGCIANDLFGNIIREDLRSSGVVDALVYRDEQNAKTGIFCTIRMKDSSDTTGRLEKIVIASPASARKIREIDIRAIDLAGARFLHTEGLLADSPEYLKRLIQSCTEQKVSVSIDLVSAEFVRKYRVALIEAIQQGIDIVFCTQHEFEALECNPNALSSRIMWIIKADRNGVDCSIGAEHYHVDAPTCEIVDDVGAGDAFAGAFLAARIARKSIPQSLEVASASAACALGILGPRPERGCIEDLRRTFLAD